MTFRASNGAALHVEETGKGPTILCLHGLGGGTHFFDEFAARSRDHYRVCAVDLPGTGRSTATSSAFSMEGWVETFGELLAKHFQSPIILLGHSMSVILALKLYIACPDRVTSLILVGGLAEARPLIRERLSKRIERVSRQGMTGLGREAAPGVFAPRTMEDQPELVARFAQRLEALDAGSYLHCIRILLGASALNVLSGIQAPCLVVSGSDDQYAPPEDISDFAQRLPNLTQQVVLPECGHLPFLEAPREFTNAVSQFV